MKVNLNLSIDMETAQIVQQMRSEGYTPSHFFAKAVKALSDMNYTLPCCIEQDDEQ